MPSARRGRVLCKRSAIRRPTSGAQSCLLKATVSKSLEAHKIARNQGQPAGKEEDGTLIDHLLWRNGQLDESLLRSLVARWS